MKCPSCACDLNFQAAANPAHLGTPPAPGDATICVQCRGIGIYADDGNLRTPTDEELKKLLRSMEMQAAIFTVSEMHRVGMFSPPDD